MKNNTFYFLIIGLAVYNLWYGAFCWEVGKIGGLLFGSSLMVLAGIVGITYKNHNTAKKEDK